MVHGLFTSDHPGVFRYRAKPLTDLDKVEFHARFLVTKQCFGNLLTKLEPDLNHATDSHGGQLPTQQLAIALSF